MIYSGRMDHQEEIDMSIAEFIKLRKEIEALIVETKIWVKQKSINESSVRIDELRRLLLDLK
jgi:hypothetical protein